MFAISLQKDTNKYRNRGFLSTFLFPLGHSLGPFIVSFFIVSFYTTTVQAGPFTVSTTTEKNETETRVKVSGVVGESFLVTYTDANGKQQQRSVTISLFGAGNTLIQPKKGTTVTIKNQTQPAVPASTFVASLFDPPSNIVVSDYAINVGSTLNFGGDLFDIVGSFTTIDTTIDYDPFSPSYGIEEGFLSEFDIQAIGPTGVVTFDINGTPTYTQDFSSIWGLLIPPIGLSMPYLTSFSGDLAFNSSVSPFTGDFIGEITFFDDGSQTVSGALNMSTGFGLASGALTASAKPSLVPSPATLPLLGLGLIFLLGHRFNRRQEMKVQKLSTEKKADNSSDLMMPPDTCMHSDRKMLNVRNWDNHELSH